MIPDRVNEPRDPRKTYAAPDVCSSLASLCRGKKRTINSKMVHTKWYPGRVRHPKTGDPFRPDEAWEFVAQQLEAGIDVEIHEQRTQSGKKAFVCKPKGHGDEIIYVKLQFGASGVIGQSFHVSDPKNGSDEE